MTGTPRSDMETGPSPPAEKKRLKLRWYQYSLRSLMLFVTACAIACSWLAVTIQNQRKQKAAAEAIETAGGWAGYEQTWLGELLRDNSLVAVSEVTLVGKPETLLENLQGLNQLQKLELRGMRLTETGLVHLEGLRQLQSLCLDYTKVADAGLAHIEGLRQLQGLMLGDTQITDAGLVHVRGLAQLQSLLLENTQVTDAGSRAFGRAKSTQMADSRKYPSHRCGAGTFARIESTSRVGTRRHQSHQRGSEETPAGIAELQNCAPMREAR